MIPQRSPTAQIDEILGNIASYKFISLQGTAKIPFQPKLDIIFRRDQSLPFHPNGITFVADCGEAGELRETYYSIGGGFVVQENDESILYSEPVQLPYPIDTSADVLKWHRSTGKAIWEIVLENEKVWRDENDRALRTTGGLESDAGKYIPGLPNGRYASRRP